jgi:hypothetical protein
MAKRALNQDFALRRIFLRVPIKSAARVFVEQEFSREVHLNDISSGGLSFFTTTAPPLPDYFNIEFHLEPAGKPVSATLAVKSRIPEGEKLRVGCNFFQINEADKNHITQYICKFTNLTKPLKALALATFLCYLDALWRILAYFLYYRAAEFERLSKVPLSYRFYFFILLLYGACAAYGFILSGRPAEKLGKTRFLLSAVCLCVGCFFVVAKASIYLSFSLANPLPMFLDGFIWIYLIFAVYVGYAEISVLLWARRIDATSQILERHSSFAPQ